jgi:hypothetical protein
LAAGGGGGGDGEGGAKWILFAPPPLSSHQSLTTFRLNINCVGDLLEFN